MSIRNLYTNTPESTSVRLHEVTFFQDGPRISFRLDIHTFPDNPPKKWLAENFNRAQITISLIDIRNASIQGWGLDNVGNLYVTRQDDKTRVLFIGESTLIDCQSIFLRLDSISGYRDLSYHSINTSNQ
ncbi:Imm50 family immunity protein [Planctomicrobium sp. SH664]|uniref:Imm50 family immunity protein n=1 Tax=Planctomicrobium sp. SH664 TaxID=3448125 RepID=UPI003F5B718C